MPILDPEQSFRIDADPDPNPNQDPTPSFTHVGIWDKEIYFYSQWQRRHNFKYLGKHIEIFIKKIFKMCLEFKPIRIGLIPIRIHKTEKNLYLQCLPLCIHFVMQVVIKL